MEMDKGDTTPLILGMTFIKKARVTLNVDDNTVTIKD